MLDASERKKLGGLIVELGLLDNRDLGQALSIAQETSLPLGRVLVLSEMLTEETLQGVLRCQSLMKQNLVDLDLARKAMKLVAQDGVSIDDALFKLGWNHEATKDTTPLGELLIDAGYVSREQLQQTLEKSSTSGLPFGRLLVFSGILTEGLLTGALNAQILIRDGKLSKQQAVEALKEARQRQVTVEVQLKEKGFYDLPSRSCPRLGELLLFCGVISQSDLVSALELGLMNKTPVGQVLTSSNQVSRKIMDAALHVQNLMAEQTMSITDARAVISAVKEGSTLEDAISELQTEAEESGSEEAEPEKHYLSLFEFLKNLGRTDEAQVNEAFQIAMHNSDVLSQVLLISGSLDAKTIERAEKCRKLVQDKKLPMEHGNIAFDYAERFDIDVSQALKELQWHRPEEMDEEELEALTEESAEKPAVAEKSGVGAAKAAAHKGGHAEKTPAGRGRGATGGGGNGADKEHEDGAEADGSEAVDAHAEAVSEWETLTKKLEHLSVSGKLDKALDTRIRLLQLAEEFFPERRIDCLDAVAALYVQRLNMDQAEQYYLKSMELRKAEGEDNGPRLAQGYCNLGKVSYFKQDYPAAEEHARKFIEVIANSLGKGHPDVACGWQNLANIFYVQKKYVQAQRAYQVGIQICEKGLGETHPTTVQMKRSYSILLAAIDPDDAANLRRSGSLGVITGSWRTLPPDAGQSLHEK